MRGDGRAHWIRQILMETTLPAAAAKGRAPNGLAGAAPPPALALENVTRRFGDFVAVRDVSVSFEAGGVYGIIGPNGAGKTTLFNLLSGFLKPSHGKLWHRGEDITALPPEQVARRGIVRSFQITSIFANLSLADNILLPIQQRNGDAMRFWGGAARREEHKAEIDGILAKVGVAPELRDRPAGSLPYGQKRALELGISLAAHPDLLLLDEPTAGMTAHDVDRVTKLIGELQAGRTVIVVEHNLGVIADLAKEIVVMQQGQVLMRGTYDNVRKDPRVIEAYLGTRERHPGA
jgi:branched-chain amino acid transport system ATP-binding protein